MDFSDIISKSKLACIVGRNNEGKTYSMAEYVRNNSSKSILIDTNGKVCIIKHWLVTIDGIDYVYSGNNKNRIKIDSRLYGLINYLNNINSEFSDNSEYRSNGIKKIQNIISSMLYMNLNNIESVLFDEPDLMLDSINLDILSNIINVLVSSGIKVVIATHSTQLLSAINVHIDDIYVFKNRLIYNINRDFIHNCLMCSHKRATEIAETYKDNKKIKFEKLAIYKDRLALDSFISDIINDGNFYKAIMYNKIIVVEGMSDYIIMTERVKFIDSTCKIFIAKGKPYVYLYCKIFNALGYKVMCIYDLDNGNNSSSSSAKVLNNIINDLEADGIVTVGVDVDIEHYIGFEGSHKRDNSNSNNYKKLNAYEALKDVKAMKKVDSLLKDILNR